MVRKMNKIIKMLVIMSWGLFICLPGLAQAEFTLIGATGYHWENNPPTGGKTFDTIDSFLYGGAYTFSNVPENGSVGAIGFSNTNFSATLVNPYWSRATSLVPFSGNMSWDYKFAGAYDSSKPLTLALNYYYGATFIVAEKYTWSAGSWSGEASNIPNAPVPLPASVLLLGTGVLGLGLLGWRRQHTSGPQRFPGRT
jgi:hypothetical protein